MCQILHKKPNFIIPFKKFENCVTNNPDGYGLSYPDNGKLITLKHTEIPDADKLYRLITEELRDKDVMLHLRFNTAGATSIRNTHPFPILERGADGIDLRMAHNGTIHPYKVKADAKKEESDTRAFARLFVRPLFKRLRKGMDIEEILKDPFVIELLEDKIPAASVLTFIDGSGNTLYCHPTGNGGKEEKGWYYSNSYSFKEDYRKAKGKINVYYPKSVTGGGYWQGNYAGSDWSNNTKDTPLKEDSNVKKFTVKTGINVEDLFSLTDNLIKDLCDIEPTDAELLIKELLFELQSTTEELSRATEQLTYLKKEKAKNEK